MAAAVADMLVRTIDVACPVDHAFRVFTTMIDLWWPRGHRRYPEGSLRLDAVAGGKLVSRSPWGEEWTMGKVTLASPPTALDLDWYPGTAPQATSVQIRFEATEGGTRVTITHRPLPDTSLAWPAKVSAFANGWDTVLPAFNRHIEET